MPTREVGGTGIASIGDRGDNVLRQAYCSVLHPVSVEKRELEKDGLANVIRLRSYYLEGLPSGFWI